MPFKKSWARTGARSSPTVSVMQSLAQRLSTTQREALIDALRSCHTSTERLAFADAFEQSGQGHLWEVVCDLLISRSISRSVAASWIKDLMGALQMNTP